MSNHLTYSARTNHDELHKLLDEYGVSLETYQLGQLLTRAMVYPKNGDLGDWFTRGGHGELLFSEQAIKLDWKKKIELGKQIISNWYEEFSEELKPKVIYGNELVHLEKGGLFRRTRQIFESFVDVIESAQEIETGGYMWGVLLRS
jgi:hypothetical protein